MGMRQNVTAPVIGDKYDQIHQEILYFLEQQQDRHVNLAAIVKAVQRSVKVSRNTIVARLEDLMDQQLVHAFIPPRTHRVRYQLLEQGRAEVAVLRKRFYLPNNAVIKLSNEELKAQSQGKSLIVNLTATAVSGDGSGQTFAFTLMDLARLQQLFEDMGWAVGITDGQLVVTPPKKDSTGGN